MEQLETKLQPFHSSLDMEHPIHHYGYVVCRHRMPDSFLDLKEQFTQHLKKNLLSFSKQKIPADVPFRINKYHKFLETYDIDHHAFIKHCSRNLPAHFLDHPYIKEMLKNAKHQTGKDVAIYKSHLEFRVVRPNKGDNNPLHRDHWFPYFIPLLNVYLPIAGSHVDSAMKVVPFSHLWDDEDVIPSFSYEESALGQKTVSKDGVAYSVPTIKTSKKDIQPHHPDVVEGDFMLFSPLMVHGGGSNSSLDTRFSFEIRLEVIN